MPKCDGKEYTHLALKGNRETNPNLLLLLFHPQLRGIGKENDSPATPLDLSLSFFFLFCLVASTKFLSFLVLSYSSYSPMVQTQTVVLFFSFRLVVVVIALVVVLVMEFSELDGQTIWKRKQKHQNKHQFYLPQNKPQQVERKQVQ